MKLVSISLFTLLFSSQAFSRTTSTCYGTNQKSEKLRIFNRINRAERGDQKSLYLGGVTSAANQRGDECTTVRNDRYNNRMEVYSNPCVIVVFDKNLKTVVVEDVRRDEPTEYYSNVNCREVE
jgi:hypothetical protein